MENIEQNNADFDKWNHIKKNIDAREINPKLFPQLGEVWMCALGKNIGREQNGGGQNFSRPMLVVKKFNNEIFWILPLSTKQKKIDFYYNFRDNNKQAVSVIISQIRLTHIKRFERKLYDIDMSDVKEIKKRLGEYLV
jgi:mRNA interferase MazF